MSGRQPRWLLLLSRIFIGFPAWPILSLWTFFVSSKDCIFRQIADLSKWSWNICRIFRHQRVTALSGAHTYIWVVHTQSCFPLPRVLLHIMLPRGDEAWGTSSCGQIRLSPLISGNSSRGGERANTLVSNLLCFEACELVWRHLQFIAGKIEWIPAAGICYIMEYNTPGINNAWLNRLCPDFRTKLFSRLQKVLDGKMFPSNSQCSIIANFLAAMSLLYHFPFSQTLNREKILHLSKNASLVENSYCLPFGYLATMSFMNSEIIASKEAWEAN